MPRQGGGGGSPIRALMRLWIIDNNEVMMFAAGRDGAGRRGEDQGGKGRERQV